MSEERPDPSGTTAQFQVFVQSAADQPEQRSRTALVATIAVAVVVVLAVVGYLALR